MRTSILVLALLLPGAAVAQTKRLLPPPGIPVPDPVRGELEAGLDEFREALAGALSRVEEQPELERYFPDVEVFFKAVDGALRHDEFFRKQEFEEARELLQIGRERARQLAAGMHPWTRATGLVVRGYRSRIDDSVQPYGMVVPREWPAEPDRRRRLDLWFHGRNNKLSELRFVADRLKKRGEFTPEGAFVLHPYGRFCNANKFAGEVDVFEALEHARGDYPVDENRILARGFSMGGAATWHLAVHHAGRFAAANPGAGFAETARYQNLFRDAVPPTAIEQTLWKLYDATESAANLFNLPVVAYSGEIDKQKQAADVMAEALWQEGLNLVHLLGPETGHKYHPETKREVARLVDALAEKGRDPVPERIRFTTFTLRYPRLKWVIVEGLGEHWKRARVDARLEEKRIHVTTSNVTALRLELPPERVPGAGMPVVEIDGSELRPTGSKGSPWTAHFERVGSIWKLTAGTPGDGLRKLPGLQGPIDDVFFDRFLVVTATGQPMNERIGRWVEREQARALEHWRRFFRGEPRVVTDRELTERDIAESHLILWGDPSSHRVLARILDRLPLTWSREEVGIGERKLSAADHVPVLIFPNPLNSERYVVLNSGYTFQDSTHESNSRHIPMLPDWALLDLRVPASEPLSRRVAGAGFFDESWGVK